MRNVWNDNKGATVVFLILWFIFSYGLNGYGMMIAGALVYAAATLAPVVAPRMPGSVDPDHLDRTSGQAKALGLTAIAIWAIAWEMYLPAICIALMATTQLLRYTSAMARTGNREPSHILLAVAMPFVGIAIGSYLLTRERQTVLPGNN